MVIAYILLAFIIIGAAYGIISAVLYAVKYITTQWKIVDKQMEEDKKRLNKYEQYKNEIRNFKA